MNGLDIGMPCEEAIKICTQDYQAFKIKDTIGVYKFGDIEKAWEFTIECKMGSVVKIIDEGARKAVPEKIASKNYSLNLDFIFRIETETLN